jgi:hypothetical protein
MFISDYIPFAENEQNDERYTYTVSCNWLQRNTKTKIIFAAKYNSNKRLPDNYQNTSRTQISGTHYVGKNGKVEY